jgi:dUTP pyrophosphatase
MNISIPIFRLPHGATVELPAYATEGSAGVDLRAAITEAVTLQPGKRLLVPTGLAMMIPEGFEGQVRPRSGLAAKHGITVLNSPATIDSDYRGELKVILINLGDHDFVVEPYMRIAQFVIAAHAVAQFEEISVLSATKRGDGGFGSTGTDR